MIFEFLLLAATQQVDPPEITQDCSYDLELMLELNLNAFDQDMDGGWRPLAMRGCEAEAAELIREWRQEKRAHNSILYWHEGQMRANIGETAHAIALFNLTYKSPALDADFGWNHYVDGTIAFLERDSERLSAAIRALGDVPEPDDLEITLEDGRTVALSWPPNMDVLRGFERCWDRAYEAAYGSVECREPLTT